MACTLHRFGTPHRHYVAILPKLPYGAPAGIAGDRFLTIDARAVHNACSALKEDDHAGST